MSRPPKKQKTGAGTHVVRPGGEQGADVLVRPREYPTYPRIGMLFHVDVETRGRSVIRRHLEFECVTPDFIRAWIAQPQQRLALRQSARASGLCHVTFDIEPEFETTHMNRAQVSLHEDNCVLLVFTSEDNPHAIPVTVYKPAPDSDDPATIGSVVQQGWLLRIERIRPPETRIAVLDYWNEG